MTAEDRRCDFCRAAVAPGHGMQMLVGKRMLIFCLNDRCDAQAMGAYCERLPLDKQPTVPYTDDRKETTR